MRLYGENENLCIFLENTKKDNRFLKRDDYSSTQRRQKKFHGNKNKKTLDSSKNGEYSYIGHIYKNLDTCVHIPKTNQRKAFKT